MTKTLKRENQNTFHSYMLLPSVEICQYVNHNRSIYTEWSWPLWYHYMMINEKSVCALITTVGHEHISRSTANIKEQIWERERKVHLPVMLAVRWCQLHLPEMPCFSTGFKRPEVDCIYNTFFSDSYQQVSFGLWIPFNTDSFHLVFCMMDRLQPVLFQCRKRHAVTYDQCHK